VIKPALDFGSQELRRAAVVLGQGVDEADVAVNRTLSLAVESEILNEFLA
jgi:hypothetical protein